MLSDRLKPYADKIRRREISAREVAAILGTNETYVCRVLKRMKIQRDPIVQPVTDKLISAARAEHRLHCAQTMEPKDAAKAANCSLRTIYRLRNKP